MSFSPDPHVLLTFCIAAALIAAATLRPRAHAGRGSRSRWVAVGTVTASVVGGGVLLASAAEPASGVASAFVPITPCRLLDTRASNAVGRRVTPIGAAESYTAQATGTNGNCTIPASATGLSLNVVSINPTASSFLTVFPADKDLPLASSLNYVAGQPPTPNAVTVALSVDGRVSFFNNSGTVDLAVDVVGYYEPSAGGGVAPAGPAGPSGPAGPTGSSGPAGPTGSSGPAGQNGANAPKPARIIWVALSGGDFTTISAALASITDNSSTSRYLIKVGPGTFNEPAGIDVKNYVDIQGSGRTVTWIASTNTAAGGRTVRAVGSINAEISDLAIVNTGTGAAPTTGLQVATVTGGGFRVTEVDVSVTGTGLAYGIYTAFASPVFTNVKVSVTTTGSSANAYGFVSDIASPTVVGMASAVSTDPTSQAFAIVNYTSGSPTYTNVSAFVGGAAFSRYGFVSYGETSPTLRAVSAVGASAVTHSSTGRASVTQLKADGNVGVEVTAGSVTIDDSYLDGIVSVQRTGGTVRVSNTALVQSTSGTMSCIDTFDAVTLVPEGCP